MANLSVKPDFAKDDADIHILTHAISPSSDALFGMKYNKSAVLELIR